MISRDEAKRKHYEIIESGIINFDKKGLIDTIYDDFESRICENCEYLSKNNNSEIEWLECILDVSPLRNMALSNGYVSLFGCNQFKRKSNDL